MEARLIRKWSATAVAVLALWSATTPGQSALAQASSVVGTQFDAIVADVKALMLTDPAKAIGRGNDALAYGRRVGSSRMEATAKWLLGEAYSRVGEPDRAEPLLADALRIVRQVAPGSPLEADILLSQGGVLTATGDVGPALADLQQAHGLFRASGETRSQAKALILIALLHAGGNDNASALKYLGEANDVYRGDNGISLAILSGRGNAFKELGRFDEAEGQYAQALQLARTMKSDVLRAQVLSNVARIRLMQHELGPAETAIAEGRALSMRSGSRPIEALFQALSAQAAFLGGDLATARRQIDAHFRGVDLATTGLSDRDAHETAYRIYQASGEDRLALLHLAALKRLDDKATELARSNSAALAGARFDFANQELRITKLKADDLQKSVAFERDRARIQRIVFVGAAAATIIIITLLAIGIVTLRRSRNRLAVSNMALGKALAAKTEFLATTSHEIRTPLNGILGMTQVMLADTRMDAATRDRLSVVHGAGVTMRALVDDILDVAKMETGKMTIEHLPFDPRHLIADAARMWADQAQAKGVSFTIDLADGPSAIVGDSARLRQIVFNLLSNAVKFTAAGSIAVRMEMVGDRWRLAVTDTGIGIAPHHHHEIFEAFAQADAGTTRQFGGTGLGLAICRSLSRAMDGDVTVESALGHGATFTLDLPLVEAPAIAPPVAAQGRAAVLVVDRNPIARAMLKTVLETRDAAVTFAGSAEEAVTLSAARAPAVVLIDEATIRASGDHLGAIRALDAIAPGAWIAIMGVATLEGERKVLEMAGIDRVIVKPIGKEALLAMLFDEPIASPLVPEVA